MTSTRDPGCVRLAALVLALTSAACIGSILDAEGEGDPPGDLLHVVPDQAPSVPEAIDVEVVASPTAPVDEAGGALGWTTAPLLESVKAAMNRDSAVLVLPEVAGARDYRAFRIPAGVQVTPQGAGEKVAGTDIYCAGFRQHNDKATAAVELLRQLEIADLREPSVVVVEAIDSPCPFPGALGARRENLAVDINEVPAQDRVAFSVFPSSEVRAQFGALIVNGHGPGATLASPAAPHAPVVLARTTVKLYPKDRSTPPLASFFDDFLEDDQPRYLRRVDDGSRAFADGWLFENNKWTFTAYNTEAHHFWIERGQLHMMTADWEQDVFGALIAYPKKVAQLSDHAYVKIGFDVPSNATARRYWWVGLCGADAPGQTLDANGHLKGRNVLTPFFYQEDGYNVSVENWNCLQFFPRDGSPFRLEPSRKRSESDLRVMVNQAGAPARDNVVNVSPPQYNENEEAPGWFRTRDTAGKLTGPILDDQLLISPRTHFDVYVSRNRVILYANGQLRLCNDLGSAKLTMAEAAIGFGQVLYHSAAERVEFSRSYNDRTGQRYYLSNTPYVDVRNWDNMGFEENVGAPQGFDPAVCHTYR